MHLEQEMFESASSPCFLAVGGAGAVGGRSSKPRQQRVLGAWEVCALVPCPPPSLLGASLWSSLVLLSPGLQLWFLHAPALPEPFLMAGDYHQLIKTWDIGGVHWLMESNPEGKQPTSERAECSWTPGTA